MLINLIIIILKKKNVIIGNLLLHFPEIMLQLFNEALIEVQVIINFLNN